MSDELRALVQRLRFVRRNELAQKWPLVADLADEAAASIESLLAPVAGEDAPLDTERLRKLSRTELLRVLDEFRSERDAAKRDAMRAFDQRNLALCEMAAQEREIAELRARAEAAEAECARLRQMILWALGEVGEFPMWPDTVTNVSDDDVRYLLSDHDRLRAERDALKAALRELRAASHAYATIVLPSQGEAESEWTRFCEALRGADALLAAPEDAP